VFILTIFYNKIPEIIYLALEHDSVEIISNFNEKIVSMINIPTLTFASSDVVDASISMPASMDSWDGLISFIEQQTENSSLSHINLSKKDTLFSDFKIFNCKK
jgi:hypothetical protein